MKPNESPKKVSVIISDYSIQDGVLEVFHPKTGHRMYYRDAELRKVLKMKPSEFFDRKWKSHKGGVNGSTPGLTAEFKIHQKTFSNILMRTA